MNHRLKIIVFLLLVGLYGPAKAQFIHHFEGKRPWTAAPNIMNDNYRFVVIGDLTGGEVDGLFEKAISKINDLAPDFVISVGDLIEGYTKDAMLIKKQWDSFDRSLKKMKAPFFYVPGNHDVANPVLLEYWKNKLGHDYYSFYAGNTLFLVLNTFEPEVDGLSDDQVKYMLDKITNHPTDAPILVFSHDAIWEKADKKGFDALIPLLKKRNVTYFCGHEHRYLHKVVNGQHHYMLSELASGKELSENTNLGEFHNLMFVTKKGKEQYISNIQLEGLLSTDIVNDETEKQVNILRNKNWAYITPVVSPSPEIDKLSSSLVLKNDADYPLSVSGGFDFLEGYSFEPERIKCVVQPHSVWSIPLYLKTLRPIYIPEKNTLSLNLKGEYNQSGTELSATTSVKWILDCVNEIKFGENRDFETLYPLVVEEDWDWTGMDDGSFSYKISLVNSKELEIQIKTKDDELIQYNELGVYDQLTVYLNPDTTFGSKEEPVIIRFVQGGNPKFENKTKKYTHIIPTLQVQKTEIHASVRIPLMLFQSNGFRMNISYKDADNVQNLDPAVIWWRPEWNKKGDYPRSGLFIIKK